MSGAMSTMLSVPDLLLTYAPTHSAPLSWPFRLLIYHRYAHSHKTLIYEFHIPTSIEPHLIVVDATDVPPPPIDDSIHEAFFVAVVRSHTSLLTSFSHWRAIEHFWTTLYPSGRSFSIHDPIYKSDAEPSWMIRSGAATLYIHDMLNGKSPLHAPDSPEPEQDETLAAVMRLLELAKQ